MRLVLILFIQTCCWSVYPQNSPSHFEHIGTKEGLSQINILSIIQDSRGFMWFGTWDGLNKYDGYTIKVYRNNPKDSNSISYNYINKICESSNGDLWVATNGGGLCKFNRNKEIFKRYKYNTLDTNSIKNNIVNTVLEDSRGVVWVGTSAGLDILYEGQKKFSHLVLGGKSGPSIRIFIKSIYEDSQHNIWIGTSANGIFLYQRHTNSFLHFEHDDNNIKTIAGDDIYTFYEDHKKRLWIGTNGNGLDLYNPFSNTFNHFKHSAANSNSLPNNIILALSEDEANHLWVSTENGGISIFNYEEGTYNNIVHDEVDEESISNNSVYVVYKDAKENMWLGNFAGGVDVARRDKSLFKLYRHNMSENSLSNNQVLSISEDRQRNIWIGTDGGGLNKLNPVTGNFERYQHQPNKQSIAGNYVLDACEDSEGNMWVGSWENGITVMGAAKNTFTYFKNDPNDSNSLLTNNPWVIFEDRDKHIWVGSFGMGLDLLNADKKTFTHFVHDNNDPTSLSGINVVNIFQDSDGDLWICTEDNGLNLYNKATKNFTSFLHSDNTNSISNNNINSIFEDRDKNLWVCTMAGLNQLNKKTKEFKIITTEQGLPGNYVYGIMEDEKKNLWISTNKGVSSFNRLTGQFKNYDVADGLQGSDFKQLAYCKSKSGMMYFGGVNGFNEFNPDSIRQVPFEPPLVMTNFQVLNKDVPVALNANDQSPLKSSITETRSITLPYTSNVFSFTFATLNYTSAEKKLYAYKMVGFDNAWNEVGPSRTATYTNLNAGRYTFMVKGLNNEGKWGAQTISIDVIIKPPFWLTWWFKTLFIFLLAATVIGLYKNRVKNIKAQKIELQQQVEEKTRQLVLSAQEEHKARNEAEKARGETELSIKELRIKNKELEQFAYVASHDLQEPLRTTTSFISLLQKQYKGQLDDRADKYLNYISSASERMKVLIKDLLDFSHIGVNGTMEKADFNILFKNMVADIRLSVKQSKANIQVGPLPVMLCYPTEIKLLFQNLVINAIKFRRKEVPLQIKVTAVPVENAWQFAVSDNGIGIEMQYTEKIFDIFQRLHTRTEYSGSGIGLSHCKKIAELHHGKMWVESIPGEGSIFYFILPVQPNV